VYQITIERRFTASHALRLPDATWEPVHSHDWPVLVMVEANRLDAMETVMDFHDLERSLDAVLEPWRDKHLNECEPFVGGQVNPSAERVAWWVGEQIAAALPKGVSLVSVSVGEAEGCTAIYRP